MQSEKLKFEDLNVFKLSETQEETDKGDVTKHKMMLKDEANGIKVTIEKIGTGFSNGFVIDERPDLILGTNQTTLAEHDESEEPKDPASHVH